MRRLIFIFLYFSLSVFTLHANGDGIHFPSSVPLKSGFLPSSEAVNSLYSGVNLTASYINNLFLPEIGLSKLKLVYHSKKINTSASASFYGYKEYWNICSTVGFSRYFKPYIAFGITSFFSLYRFSITEKSFFTAGANVSLCVFPTKKICIGVSAENITFSYYKSGNIKYRLPVIFKVGFSISVRDNASILLEGSKNLTEPFLICLGTEYIPVKQFSLRLGVSYQTNFSALIGFGLKLSGFLLDFDAFYNLGSGVGCRVSIGFYKLNFEN